jgi:hypothetical protein
MQDGSFPKHKLSTKSDEMYHVPLLMLCCSPGEGGRDEAERTMHGKG